jgi:hypothetical protein
MTTTSVTAEWTVVITDLPRKRPPVLMANEEDWVRASEIHIRYAATLGDNQPTMTATSVEIYGSVLGKPAPKRPRPLITYNDETGFPEDIAADVDKNRPTNWPAPAEPTF